MTDDALRIARELDALHPYPRYGAAAALVATGRGLHDLASWPEVAHTIADALGAPDSGEPDDEPTLFTPHTAGVADRALGHFSIRPAVPTLPDEKDVPDEKKMGLTYQYVTAEHLSPGKKDRQTSAYGYYLAPHVLTSDGQAARLVVILRDLARTLREVADDSEADVALHKPVGLQRGFAPLVAKVNGGTKAQSDPRTSVLAAALTALATATPLKPARWSGATMGLVPDLPLLLPDGSTPLIEFVRLFSKLSRDLDAPMEGRQKKGGGWKRPRLHDGNFAGSMPHGSLGALGLVAAIGSWAERGSELAAHGTAQDRRQAQAVLDSLAERPLLVVSYDPLGDSGRSAAQESFGHHLVPLAMSQGLGRAVRDLMRTLPVGAASWTSPAVVRFRRDLDVWLRHFTTASFRGFVSHRAAYSPSLRPILDAFASHAMPISEDIIDAAYVFGQDLNRAASRIAAAEMPPGDSESEDDRKRNMARYWDDKAKALVEFESAARSARSGPELLMKVVSQAGRLAHAEVSPGARAFLDAVALAPEGSQMLDDLKALAIAYMRIRSPRPKKSGAASPDSTEDDNPDDASDLYQPAGGPLPVD